MKALIIAMVLTATVASAACPVTPTASERVRVVACPGGKFAVQVFDGEWQNYIEPRPCMFIDKHAAREYRDAARLTLQNQDMLACPPPETRPYEPVRVEE